MNNKYFDSFCHELHIGSPVMCLVCDYRIFGHIIDMSKDNKGNEKYVVVLDIGYKSSHEIRLKRKYTVNWKRTFLINLK